MAPGPQAASRGKAFDNSVLFWILGVSLAVQTAFVVFSPLFNLIRNDDAFYFFTIARNFPATRTWSFDGIEPTNGVQPLWAALLCLLRFLTLPWLQGPDPLLRSFLLLAVALNILSGMLFVRLVERTWDRRTALGIGLIWLLGPFVLFRQTQGTESSLNAFVLLGILFFLARNPTREDSALPSLLVLGLLLGIGFLARLDNALLALVVGVALVLREWRRPGRWVPRAAALSTGFLAAAGPYLFYNLRSFGRLFPVSGTVKLHKSALAYADAGGFFSPGAVLLVLSAGAKAGKKILNSVLGKGVYTVATLAADRTAVVQVVLALFLLVVVIALLRERPVRRAFAGSLQTFHRRIPFFLPFVILHFAVSVVLYPKEMGYAGPDWWMIPEYVAVFLALGAFLAAVLRHGRRPIPKSLFVGFVAVNMLLADGFVLLRRDLYPDSRFSFVQQAKVDAARWINRNLPLDTIVGSWNAGILAYFCERPVVNLDGLANNFEFLEYLRENRVYDYVLDRKIRFVADYDAGPPPGPHSPFLGMVPVERVVYDAPVPGYDFRFYIAEVRCPEDSPPGAGSGVSTSSPGGAPSGRIAGSMTSTDFSRLSS